MAWRSLTRPERRPSRNGKEACMTERPAGPRCAALVGPYLSGKTTLLEALLFASGTTHRRGTAKEGNTVGDHAPEARAGRCRPRSTSPRATYLDDPWTFLDCPGSVELELGGAERAAGRRCGGRRLRAGDRAGPDLGPLFKFLDDHQIPHMMFINKMDTADGARQRGAGGAARRCRSGRWCCGKCRCPTARARSPAMSTW